MSQINFSAVASQWKQVGATAPSELIVTREQLHQSVQWVGSVARSYSPTSEEDEFGSLDWSTDWDTMTSVEISGGVQIALKVESFRLQFYKDKKLVAEAGAHGKSEGDLHQWVKERLTDLGFDSSQLRTDLPYQLIPLSSSVGSPVKEEALIEFSNLYHNFQNVLVAVLQAFDGSPIKIWPHHFDIATLLNIDFGKSTTFNIGVGLSPGDDHYDEPYIYVTPWQTPEKIDYPTLNDGHWNQGEWAGAVLKYSDFKSEGQFDQIAGFIQDAIEKALKILEQV